VKSVVRHLASFLRFASPSLRVGGSVSTEKLLAEDRRFGRSSEEGFLGHELIAHLARGDRATHPLSIMFGLVRSALRAETRPVPAQIPSKEADCGHIPWGNARYPKNRSGVAIPGIASLFPHGGWNRVGWHDECRAVSGTQNIHHRRLGNESLPRGWRSDMIRSSRAPEEPDRPIFDAAERRRQDAVVRPVRPAPLGGSEVGGIVRYPDPLL